MFRISKGGPALGSERPKDVMTQNGSIEIVLWEPSSPFSTAVIAALFREYAKELNVDLCFQGFEDELAALPGQYAAPEGAIILAVQGAEALGCVAIRAIDWKQKSCEMKRLYLKQELRGQGVGKQLASVAVAKAEALGYHLMRLDTLLTLVPAMEIYKTLGFEQVKPYYANPLSDVVYWQKVLRRPAQEKESS